MAGITTVNLEQTKCNLEDTKVEESHNIQDALVEPRQAMDLSHTNGQSFGGSSRQFFIPFRTIPRIQLS